MTGKTLPELTAAIDVVGTDLLATYRSPGPLKKVTATLLADYMRAQIRRATVPCTVSSAGARSYPMTPVTGYSVVASGANQVFSGFSGTTNAEGQTGSVVTATIAGVFSGAATEIVMPNGNSLPVGVIQLDSPFAVQASTARGKYVLLYPSFPTQDTFVMLEWVSGTGNSVIAKLAFPNTKLPADFGKVRFVFQPQGNSLAGGKNLTIRNFANTADLLPLTAIYEKTGVTQLSAADAWQAFQWVEVTRPASGRLLIVEYPSAVLNTATNQDAALAFQLRTVLKPVFAELVTDKLWAIDVPVIYDDTSPVTSRKMNQDRHRILMYNYGVAMSGGVLKSAYAWGINSNSASIGGVDYDYGMLYSDEQGGGTYQGDNPSTFEFAMPIGLHSASSATYEFYGFGHVQMALNGTPTISMDGGASLLTAAAGTRERGSSLVFTAVYDIYRPPTLTPTRVGQVTVVHTFNASGCTVAHTHRVGRTMAYTAGNTSPAIGATITGLTSGATAIVVVAPTPTTGTYAASSAAGEWYVRTVTGTFQAGEALQVSAVTIGTMNGTLGAQIGVDNAYAAMLPTTSITAVKVPTYAAITVGYELAPGDPNYQRPNVPTDGIATWAGQSRMQFYQPNVAANVIHEMILNGSFPLDPPGDYSLCVTTQMFVQDRAEGVRKGYANWVSGGKQVYEGTHTGSQTYRFRVGALV